MNSEFVQFARKWGACGIVAACLVTTLGIGSAWAAEAFPLDRDYLMGDYDDGFFVEAGVAGQPVGYKIQGDPTFWTFTIDGVGVDAVGAVLSSYQEMAAVGDPVYASAATRPGAAAGTVGISFDGVNDYLVVAQLNAPSNSIASTGYNDQPGLTPGSQVGPNDYSGISNRYYEFWAKPDATAAANPALTQSLVMDSNQHGVQIVNGNWSLRYNNNDVDSGVAVADTVDANGWAHVMVARPLGTGGGGRLYVNGIAIAARGGGYNGNDHTELVVGSNTARTDNEFSGGTTDFYKGVVDDLTMTLVGHNGTIENDFDFFTDNEAAASYQNGIALEDLNRDGNVDQDDVTEFVAGWLNRNEVNGVLVGDITSLAKGDINSDGITDLSDAYLLHEALKPAAGAALMSAIPEPGAAFLMLLGVSLLGLIRRR